MTGTIVGQFSPKFVFPEHSNFKIRGSERTSPVVAGCSLPNVWLSKKRHGRKPTRQIGFISTKEAAEVTVNLWKNGLLNLEFKRY